MKSTRQVTLVLVFLCVAVGAGTVLYLKNHSVESIGMTLPELVLKSPEPSVEAAKPLSKPDIHQRYCDDPYATTCYTSWPSEDPTGLVRPDMTGEVRALRVMRRLIRENPLWTSQQVQEVLAESIYTEERRARIQNAFAWVMAEMREFIQQQPVKIMSDQEKAALLKQVALISLELPPPISVYADAEDIITKNTVYYERTPRQSLRLRIGGAYLLTSSSWFNIVYTFAHEVAHAIDPCEVSYAGFKPKAYEKLIGCFVSAGWVDKDRTVCGPNEQISEVFADWVASELIGKAIKDFGKDYSLQNKAKSAINAVRDLCEQPAGESLDFKLHQQPNVRIGSIMGRSPTVLSALNCQPKKKIRYCRFEE